MKIRNLKDLEDKIIGIIVAALAVAFLGQAAGADEPSALLNYGGGIALVIVLWALTVIAVISANFTTASRGRYFAIMFMVSIPCVGVTALLAGQFLEKSARTAAR